MKVRAIRGAITVDNNTEQEVSEAVKILITAVMSKNEIKTEDIASVIFSTTKDIDCVYPAKCVRELFPDWKYVPMMCVAEADIKNSLKKCIRVSVSVNTETDQKDIIHVYLNDAEILRKDLLS